MTHSHDTAFPAGTDGDENRPAVTPLHEGLTKREYFAAAALQGLLARGFVTEYDGRIAVDLADRLIVELNKDRPA